MREAQTLRVGNCVKIGDELYIIHKNDYTKGSEKASICKMKMKGVLTGSVIDKVFKAEDRFELVVLDQRKMQYLYTDGEHYTFMDQETFEQMDLNKDDLGDALDFLMEQMVIDVSVYGEKAVSVQMPKQVEVEITYTEPAVKGNTGGKVLKAATINTGIDVQVPLYCNIGDKIRVDTETYEFVSRAN